MEKILIQIAAYRDAELLPTIENAISQAKYPERLVFAVCYQEHKGEEYERLLKIPSCRVIQVNPEDSKGVSWARSLTQTLWQGEEYTLQIDSHMRFVPDWDALAIEMLHQCPGKPILTGVTASYYPGEEELKEEPAYTFGADYYNYYGMQHFRPRIPILQDVKTGEWEGRRPPVAIISDKPVPGAFWAANFSFSSGSFIADVPYDPELYFYSEEFTHAVRAYTHGYDFYYPHRTLSYHCDGNARNTQPAHWLDNDATLQEALAAQKARRLLGMEPSDIDFGEFGLGTVRTRQDYEAYTGVDFQKRSVTAKAFLGVYGEMEPIRNYSIPNQKQNVLGVTAFRDIGRRKWLARQRSTELYLDWFSMLGGLKNLNLVCYCDDALRERLPAGEYEVRPFEEEDTFWGSYMEQARKIARDPDFQKAINKTSMYHPEHFLPKYALLTHCKTDFLRRAKNQFPEFDYYIWIDFGGCRVSVDPDVKFDWSPWLDDKIHFQTYRDMEKYSEDFPEDYLSLCQVPDVIDPSVFIVPKEKVDWYAAVYEEELRAMLDGGVLDDSQSVMLRLTQKYPEQIVCERIGEWDHLLYQAIP